MNLKYQLNATLNQQQVTELITQALERETGLKVKSVSYNVGHGPSSHPMYEGNLELNGVSVEFEGKKTPDGTGPFYR